MPDDIVAIRAFSDEIEADMALQLLEGGGVRGFVFKDDAGGMEPHLQRTSGVRLIVNRAEAERALEILQSLDI
ncbi:MAG: hypothetical protein JWM21_2991 [Acidobacteria bacterium]|nr:hypothetical protein [Acidobacteriota bacterium]